MKSFFPRMSFTLDYGENTHSGDIGLVSVGYAFHQAWIFCAMFAPTVLFSLEEESAGLASFGMTQACLISLMVNALCLIFEGFTNKQFRHLYRSKPMVVAASLTMFAGTLLQFIHVENALFNVVLSVLVGVLTGFGSSILLLAWGVRFARCGIASIRANAIIAFSLSFALYLFILTMLPYPFGGIATAVLPLLELLLLLIHPSFGVGKNTKQELFFPLPVRASVFLMKFGLPVLVFSIALGFLRMVAIHPIDKSNLESALIAVFLAATILFVITLVLPKQEDGWTFNFKIIGLIVVAAIAAFFLEDPSLHSTLQTIIVITGYLCFETLMWSYFSEFSQSFRLAPVLVFGVGRGFAGLATALIAAICTYGAHQENDALFSNSTFTLIILVVLVVAFILLPSQAEIRHILCPDALEQSIKNSNESPNERIAASEEVVNTDTSASTSNSACTQTGTLDTDAHTSVSSSSTSEHDTDAHHSSAALNNPHTFDLDTNSAQQPAGKKRRAFYEKCQIVANTYMLSAREQEVLFYLAKGYNAALIQEKLYISEGTAKTHMRHIYRKLDIHTQQDLMRVVEAAER